MSRSVLIFSDKTLKRNTRGGAETDINKLQALFQTAGFEVSVTTAAGLAEKLTKNEADIFLADCSTAFPAEAVEPLKSYCQNGGKLITIGGYAFYDIISDSFEPDEKRRCISVSSQKVTTSAWKATFTPQSPEIGGPMAGILSNVSSFNGFDAGETMVVKFWMKSENVQPGSCGVTISFYKDNELLSESKISKDGEGWQYVFKRVPTPLGTNKIEITAGLNGASGKVSFDGLHIGIDHYTRVYDCDFEGKMNEWVQQGDACFAIEPREKEYYLSSVFADNVEDNAFFREDSIPLFDLEAAIKDTSAIVAAPDQVMFAKEAKLEGSFTGWSAIAPTGSEASRWQPLLLCLDAAGTIRGYAGALIRCFDTAHKEKQTRNTCWANYPGFSAAFFGITSENIFEHKPFAQGLVNTAKILLNTPYITRINNRYDCYRPNEAASISGVISDEKFKGKLKVSLYDETMNVIEEKEISVEDKFDYTFNSTGFKDDFYKITCKLFALDGKELDEYSTGFVVWQQKTIDNGPHLNYHDNLYYINHGKGTPEKAVFGTGVDDTAGRVRTGLINPLAMKDEFIRRRDLGLCVYEALDNVRSYPDDKEKREQHLRTHDAVVALCCKYDQIYMMGLAIGDNVACSDSRIAESANGIKEAAERYKNNRNIIYYINGDFFCRLDEHTIPVLQPVFNKFLNERYPNDQVLQKAWGEPEVTRNNAVLTGNWPDGRCYADKKAQDYNFFRYYLQNRWIGPLTKAVHDVDKKLPCTSEYYETPKFSVDVPRSINNHDISNIGCFSHFSEFSQRLAYADQRFANKGFGIGEYGKRGHELYRYTDCEYMRYFPQNEVMDTTAHYLNGAYAMGANHCHVWCYIDIADGNFPWGIINSDNTPRDLAYWVRNFNFMAHQNEAVDKTPDVALLLPDNTRSAASRKYQGGHYAAIKAISVLQHVSKRVITLNECNFVIPKEVKAIFYPVAFNPPKKVFDKLCDWVKKGGVLYVSGDISGDGDFYGKSESDLIVDGRLEKLMSLSCAGRNYAGLDYPQSKTEYTSCVNSELNRSGCPYMKVSVVDEKNVQVIAKDENGSGVLFKSEYGNGSVIFNTDPCEAFFCGETIAADKALYSYVLDIAKASSADIKSDTVEDIKVFELPLKSGGRIVNISNISEKSGEIEFEGRYVLTQNSLRSQMLRENADGGLTGTLFEGKLGCDGKVIACNTAYAYILSCDEQVLSDSQRIAVLPQKAGHVSINNGLCKKLVAGQIENGQFVEVFASKLDENGFEVKEEYRNYIYLLCEDGDEESFKKYAQSNMINLVN